MRQLLILSFIFSQAVWALETSPATLKYGFGMGFESRYQEQVNTALSENQINPEIFLRGQFRSIAIHLNLLSYSEASSVGALFVERRVLEVMPWLRYEFLNTRLIQPFVGVGVGVLSQRLRTQLNQSVDVRRTEPEVQYGLLGGFMLRGQTYENVFFETSTKWVIPDRSRQSWWAFNFALGVEL